MSAITINVPSTTLNKHRFCFLSRQMDQWHRGPIGDMPDDN
jgi:hypothetical protein